MSGWTKIYMMLVFLLGGALILAGLSNGASTQTMAHYGFRAWCWLIGTWMFGWLVGTLTPVDKGQLLFGKSSLTLGQRVFKDTVSPLLLLVALITGVIGSMVQIVKLLG